MTNGDKIRAMSNDEWAERINDSLRYHCLYCVNMIGDKKCKETGCVSGILEYLNQEVTA